MILATHPEVVRGTADPVGLVSAVVRELFGDAPSADRWYSLAPILQLLAETTPDAFLSAVERDAVGNAEVQAMLFREEGMFGGGSRHTQLLWALETIAWSPDYLVRVVLALGGLAAHDPGGRTSNRPAASLRSVLLAWVTYTAAPVARKLAAIDSLARRNPDIASSSTCCVLRPPSPWAVPN